MKSVNSSMLCTVLPLNCEIILDTQIMWLHNQQNLVPQNLIIIFLMIIQCMIYC